MKQNKVQKFLGLKIILYLGGEGGGGRVRLIIGSISYHRWVDLYLRGLKGGGGQELRGWSFYIKFIRQLSNMRFLDNNFVTRCYYLSQGTFLI